MELNNIDTLLDKYINASTTLQEEEILKQYFNSDTVAPHHKQYGMMFDYFKESKQDTFTKNIVLTPKTLNNNRKWLSIAASIALLVSIFIGKQQYTKYQQRQQFIKIKEALQLVSFNLNKGNDALYSVSSNLIKGSDAVSQLDTYNKTVHTVIDKVNY